jgi:hypothetical protein
MIKSFLVFHFSWEKRRPHAVRPAMYRYNNYDVVLGVARLQSVEGLVRGGPIETLGSPLVLGVRTDSETVLSF